MLIMVTGGARSGKSTFAERYAACLGGSGVYIATAQIYDDEMRERVELHKRQRQASGFAWTTIEEPYALAQTLDRLLTAPEPKPAPVVLVDCLTLWLSNWLLRDERGESSPERVMAKVDELIRVAARAARPGAAESGTPQRPPAGGALRQPAEPDGPEPGARGAATERTAGATGGPDGVLRPVIIFVTNEVGSGIVPEYALGRQFRDLAGRLNQRLASICDQVFLVTAGIPVELKSRAFRFPSSVRI